ncbi:MAG: hypothetical protein MJE68_03290, partial [Proteobacteria bacterium]|nr:hypothetical protein [Pseudomonadota bacterium]
MLKKKDGYSIEQCSKDFKCSLTVLKRVISGKKQKGGRQYKREAEARERSDAPPTEEERPEQPTAPVAKDAPAADPAFEIIIELDEMVCKICDEGYAPEEVLINHYSTEHPQWAQHISCRYCHEIIKGYANYLDHVDEHVADGCTCSMCDKVCRRLGNLAKHMKKSHPVSDEDDDPGDQAPKDTGEVEDTAQQEQATGDPGELPDLVVNEPRIQPPQPPSAAAGAPTPGMPEEEKEKKGHKEASEKYKLECEKCNRYFKDAYGRQGHINAYHKDCIRICAFCKSGYLYPWDYDKHVKKVHVWCDNCHKYVRDWA